MSDTGVAMQLHAIVPFDVASNASLERLKPSLRELRLSAGADLVRVGESADEVFVLVDGQLEIIAPGASGSDDVVLGRIDAGQVVGEIAVLTGGTRSATLRALGPVRAIGITGAGFSALLENEPVIGARLARLASARLRATRLTGQLQRLFPGSTGLPLAELVERVRFTELEAGEALFAEGDPADAAYVIVSGRVRILIRTEDGWASPIAEVGAGELIGELALLDDQPRSATVVAARDTVLAVLPRADFEVLTTSHPSAMLAVTRTIVARSRDQRESFRRARSDHASIGLVPITAGLEIDGFAQALTRQLQTADRVRLVTADSLDAELGVTQIAHAGRGEPDELRLERWLEEAEANVDLLVLQGEREATAWTRRCVTNVDHLVLVADATTEPEIREVERELVATRALPHQRVSLVLLHPSDTECPRGTPGWLEPRDVDEHHHVRQDHEGDLARLARHLAGRAVSLVLSGGGAKGFAHLGVVRAMRELGIPIDAVAGSSMGAPLAALVAVETPDDELEATTARLYHNVLDYTVPVTSLIAARRLVRAIDTGTDDRDITDAWLPFFAVSTNLTRSRLEVHRRGSMALAIRASLSIPGVMPPVPYGEDLLVDGGVLNNLPVDLAREFNPTGTVIASDVAPLLGPRAKQDYGQWVSGTQVLLKRLTPGAKAPRVPALAATLLRSLLVAAAEQRDRGIAAGLADLHLQLDLRGVSLLDFEVCAPVAQQGYEEAHGLLADWLEEQVDVPVVSQPAPTAAGAR